MPTDGESEAYIDRLVNHLKKELLGCFERNPRLRNICSSDDLDKAIYNDDLDINFAEMVNLELCQFSGDRLRAIKMARRKIDKWLKLELPKVSFGVAGGGERRSPSTGGRRKKIFVTLELTEVEARALLHVVDVGLVASGHGRGLPLQNPPVLGVWAYPGGDVEVAAVRRVAKQIRPLFAHGIWFKVLASELRDASELCDACGGDGCDVCSSTGRKDKGLGAGGVK